MDALIDVRNVGKVYGKGRLEVSALKGVSLQLEPGEAVALMGPSGCGKSTLLNVIGLILEPSSGHVEIAGRQAPKDERKRAALRNQFFGFVQQNFAIIDGETVERNVMIPLEYARPRVSRRARRDRTSVGLDQVGLGWASKRRPTQLSGGERQRVAIARALLNEPQVLLADEPTAALDTATATDIVDLMMSVRRRGAAVLLATHDPRVAERCDRIVTLRDGQLSLGESLSLRQ